MALRFAGDGTYAAKTLAFTTGKGTLALRFMLLADTNSYTTIVELNNISDHQVVVGTTSNGTTLQCYTYNSAVTGPSLSLDQWYSLAVTWDGADTKVYLDDSLAITNPNDGADWNEVRLGASVAGEPLNGAICDLHAWNATLSAKDLRSQAKKQTPITFDNLLLWLPTLPLEPLLDSNGNPLLDSNGNVIYDYAGPLRDYSGHSNDLVPDGPGTIDYYANAKVPWGSGSSGKPNRNVPQAYDGGATLAAAAAIVPSWRTIVEAALSLGTSAGVSDGASWQLPEGANIDVTLATAQSAARSLVETLAALGVQLDAVPSIGNYYADTLDMALSAGLALAHGVSLEAVLQPMSALLGLEASGAPILQASLQLALDAAAAAAETAQTYPALSLNLNATVAGEVGGVSYGGHLQLSHLQQLSAAARAEVLNTVVCDLSVSVTWAPSHLQYGDIALDLAAGAAAQGGQIVPVTLTLPVALDLAGDTLLDAYVSAPLALRVAQALATQIDAQNAVALRLAQALSGGGIQILFAEISQQLAAGLAARSAAYTVDADTAECRSMVVAVELRRMVVAVRPYKMVVPVQPRRMAVAAQPRIMQVAPQPRRMTVAAEVRRLLVAAEDRRLSVPPESRRMTVSC